MLDMIQDRMEIMKHKRKDDKWAKVRDQIVSYCQEHGEIEVEGKDGACVYIGKKLDMSEPGRIIVK